MWCSEKNTKLDETANHCWEWTGSSFRTVSAVYVFTTRWCHSLHTETVTGWGFSLDSRQKHVRNLSDGKKELAVIQSFVRLWDRLWPEQKVSCGDGCGSQTAQPVSQLLLVHRHCLHIKIFKDACFRLLTIWLIFICIIWALWRIQVHEHSLVFFLTLSVVMALVRYGERNHLPLNVHVFL